MLKIEVSDRNPLNKIHTEEHKIHFYYHLMSDESFWIVLFTSILIFPPFKLRDFVINNVDKFINKSWLSLRIRKNARKIRVSRVWVLYSYGEKRTALVLLPRLPFELSHEPRERPTTTTDSLQGLESFVRTPSSIFATPPHHSHWRCTFLALRRAKCICKRFRVFEDVKSLWPGHVLSSLSRNFIRLTHVKNKRDGARWSWEIGIWVTSHTHTHITQAWVTGIGMFDNNAYLLRSASTDR